MLGGEKGKQILSCVELPVMFRSWQRWTAHLSINRLQSLCVSCLVKLGALYPLVLFLFKYLVITVFTLCSVRPCCSHFSLCSTWRPGVYSVQSAVKLAVNCRPAWCFVICHVFYSENIQDKMPQKWRVSIERDFHLFTHWRWRLCYDTKTLQEDFKQQQKILSLGKKMYHVGCFVILKLKHFFPKSIRCFNKEKLYFF